MLWSLEAWVSTLPPFHNDIWQAIYFCNLSFFIYESVREFN